MLIKNAELYINRTVELFGNSGGDVCVAAMVYDRSVWIPCECVMVMGGG